MGICWGSPAHDPANTEKSQERTQTTSSMDRSDSGKNRFSESREDKAFPIGQIFSTPNLRFFSLEELKTATKNFKARTVLTEGDSSEIFKGWIDQKIPGNSASGTVIAVKIMIVESLQKFQECQLEINRWGRLSHPNLVRLLGYCSEDENLYLVYEFMTKGSLEDHLFQWSSNIQVLSWDLRLKIAVGAARGLAFLHSLEKQVVYKNFRASNIFLDGSYTAKISSFGLAKIDSPTSQVNVHAAPEYIGTGQFCVKSDVYSFGVFLLEVMSGLRALDMNRPMGEQNLVEWAKQCLSDKRKLLQVMDHKLEGQYSYESAHQIAELVLKCLNGEPSHRPEMKQVVKKLEQLQEANKRLLNTAKTSDFGLAKIDTFVDQV